VLESRSLLAERPRPVAARGRLFETQGQRGRRLPSGLCTTANIFRCVAASRARAKPADQQQPFLAFAFQNSCRPGKQFAGAARGPQLQAASACSQAAPLSAGTFRRKLAPHHFTRTDLQRQACWPGQSPERAKPSQRPADPPGTGARGRSPGPCSLVAAKRRTAMASDASWRLSAQPLGCGGLHPHLLRGYTQDAAGDWRHRIARCGA